MVGDEDTDAAEQETFHDALDQHDDLESESHPRHTSKQAEKSEPSSVGKKRRHWEIETSSRLLQPTQPDPQKRVAIATDTTPNTAVLVTTGLLKSRSFTPSPTTTVWSRRGSGASDMTSVSRGSLGRSSLWTSQDWRMLEKTYDDMGGDSMAESDLDPVADRFLKEHEKKTGVTPPWSRYFEVWFRARQWVSDTCNGMRR